MPELPDIQIYIEALTKRINNKKLISVKFGNPFLLRTVEPGVDAFHQQSLVEVRRIGKRIALGFKNNHWLVIHLMIAGRLQWIDAGKKIPARKSLALFEFETGHLIFTEAGTKRRAALHLFASESDMLSLDRGGLELFDITEEQFTNRLVSRNHTLKRALSDQSLFSGIGNAYSDEILHHAQLSPVQLTQKMDTEDINRLYASCRHILKFWTDTLRDKAGETFPKKVTAFKPGMAAHGRYLKPCPVCNTKIQRIRYASNETNYCPRCQTNGKLLADRSLSRLLKKDWPKTIEALEEPAPVETGKGLPKR